MRERLADSTALRVAGVVAVAAVLRPALAGVGPILDDVQDGLALSTTSVSLLTALPVLCFGAGAFAGPWLARRLGIDVAVGALLGLLTAALAVRVAGGPALLFAGTVAAGSAIAVGNVLLPAIVKADFPDRVGTMTGVYTSTLSGSAALAALVAVPLLTWTGGGWRGSLLTWAVVAAVALAVWSPQLLGGRHDAAAIAAPPPVRGLLTSPVALAVTLFFGMQSLGFYAVLTWLPSLLQDSGYDATAAGALLSLCAAIGIPVALVLPAIAGRARSQQGYAVVVSALIVGGLTGLLVAPETGTVLWVVLLGIGQGAAFPIALLLMVLRSSSATRTGQLSAMAQGIGYLIAAAGPFLVGAVRDASGSWDAPLALLIGCSLVQAAAGWVAGRPGVAV